MSINDRFLHAILLTDISYNYAQYSGMSDQELMWKKSPPGPTRVGNLSAGEVTLNTLEEINLFYSTWKLCHQRMRNLIQFESQIFPVIKLTNFRNTI